MSPAPLLSEHSLGPVAQIPEGEGRLFECQGRLVAVFHLRNGGVRATQPWCPHRGGPLADGIIGGATLVCPLHARRFDLETGEASSGECALTVYPVHISDDGRIVLVLDAAEGEAAVGA